jgi:2',3'-cyclic-nucleotide 2'-phosphodiesterase/3'-nucleotidase
LTTYFKEAKRQNPNTVLLSSGDMWQGGSESNLTRGMIVNDWMSEMEFVSMTLGNHEFDWGTEYIESNAAQSDFAYLAINVYERATNKRADYCQPSVMIQRGGAKIGIIGAIGDCYSSISADKVTDVYFKTGNELTNLVKAEANRLKEAGADCIVYSLHDGTSGYDNSLSNSYVDVVFEGHTHSRYVTQDTYGVYHLQGGGENRNISHATLSINVVENSVVTKTAETISNYIYGEKASDPLLQSLLNKYKDEIASGNEVLGYNARYRDDSELEALVAELYLKAGLERWGAQYDIVLGGGFLRTRSPYNLSVGNVLYSDLQTLFTFDNPLVLCKISGYKLKTKFIQTTNEDYYVSYSEYGSTVKNTIDNNATYYVVVDSYTSQHAPNGLTEIARYDETTFARDLLAEYIRNDGLAK